MKIKYLFLIGLFLGTSFLIFSSPVDEVEKNIEKDHSSEKRAIFISYIELGNYLRGKSSSEGESFSVQFHTRDIDSLNEWVRKEGGALQQDLIGRYKEKIAGFSTLLEDIELPK